jgi:serine/threonine protein kinase
VRDEKLYPTFVTCQFFLQLVSNFVFRDLKPANIGFDKNGTVKIFDFGFAREHTENGEQQRKMTGGTGTPCYMAPEVARMEEDYGFPADVYSFAILLWQIVTTRVPFSEFMSFSEFYLKVVLGEQRPSLKYLKNKELATLISQCWSPDPKKRCTFPKIQSVLENIINSKA